MNQTELERMRRGVEAMRQGFEQVGRVCREKAEELSRTRIDRQRIIDSALREYTERMRRINCRHYNTVDVTRLSDRSRWKCLACGREWQDQS